MAPSYTRLCAIRTCHYCNKRRATVDHGEFGAADDLLDNLEAHLHSVDGVDTGDHVERYWRFRSIGVVRDGVIVIIRHCQVQQE